jgi:PAS domain S-box-containing protein
VKGKMMQNEQREMAAILDSGVYRVLFEKSPDGLLITDENGHLLECNATAYRALGYSREEFELLDLAGLNEVPNAAEAKIHRRQVVENGHTEFEIQQKTKNGKTRNVLVTTQKLMLSGNILFFTTWHDTSDCKCAQEELKQSVEQLEEEKAKTEAIIHAIGEGISIRDRDYRVIYQNQSNIDTVGLHTGEMCYKAFHGRDQVCEGCPVEMSFKDGKIHTAEVYTTIDNRLEYFASTASPIRDSSGNIIAAIELLRNITEKKRSEKALQEANAKLEALVNAIPDMVAFKDTQGRHLVVNKAVGEALGLPREEILGRVNEELFPADAAAMCRASDEQAMNGRGPLHFEESMTGNGGGNIYLDTIKCPIYDEQGSLSGVVIVSRDITDRKRAEEQIKASEKRLRDITANLGVGVYVLDEKGKIIFMNPMAEQLWGWSLEELQEKGVHDLVHCRRADGIALPLEECPILGVIKHGLPYSSKDEVFVRKDGTIFPISVTVTPLLEEGRVVASVTAFRDITAEKQLEAELSKIQKLESVGILAGGIAHDFNNLLQAILGSTSLARLNFEQNDVGKIPHFLKQAEDAAEAAKELSFRLLTFAKGGAPVKTIASVEEIVGKSISLSLSGSSIACEINLPQDLPSIEVDTSQIMQVFNNILINAKEAMPRGGTIHIGAKRVRISEDSPFLLKKGEYLHISIQDSGCGIPQENLPRIFDPYFSMKERGSRKGSGLGLSISMAIVRKHEGHISVESRQGQGTTFHIHLPASSEPSPVLKSEGTGRPSISGKRILFMDDDERVRRLVKEMMASLGCEVECARHGEEALALFMEAQDEGKPFAGVVLDLTVKGGMGGATAVAGLQEIDPQVRVVISSGYADNPVVRHYREYGFIGALPKPFTLDQLQELIAEF